MSQRLCATKERYIKAQQSETAATIARLKSYGGIAGTASEQEKKNHQKPDAFRAVGKHISRSISSSIKKKNFHNYSFHTSEKPGRNF